MWMVGVPVLIPVRGIFGIIPPVEKVLLKYMSNGSRSVRACLIAWKKSVLMEGQ